MLLFLVLIFRRCLLSIYLGMEFKGHSNFQISCRPNDLGQMTLKISEYMSRPMVRESKPY